MEDPAGLVAGEVCSGGFETVWVLDAVWGGDEAWGVVDEGR